MKKTLVYCQGLLLVVATTLIAQQTEPTKTEPTKTESTRPVDDETAIRKVVDQYFRGVVNADRNLLEKAWDVDSAHMKHLKMLTEPAKVNVVPISLAINWWTRVKAKTSASEVLYLDIVDGEMAFVKFKFDYNNLHYTDYLTLYKIDDAWKLVNKSFVRRTSPKKPPTANEPEKSETKKDKSD